MVAGLYLLPFFSPSGNPLEYMRAHARWAMFIVLAWLASVYFTWLLLALARQLIFRGRAAIWIDREMLVYLSSWRRSSLLPEIATVRLERYTSYGWSRHLINVERKDGSKQVIPTELLSEGREVVLQRIQHHIAR
jgi:hypothetical protein